ncbi:MAG: sigma-E processing peptidase SpoIIGA [Oscillospiraceae bacterium]|nr:sigma-E processing peptidase SpoIIGA [Oscillospiraceae bacterium]
MYIYADILIIINIYADFLLIKSAAAITHSPLKTGRAVAAAVIGGFFSLAIFLPKGLAFLLAPLKLISSAVIVLTAFGFENLPCFFRRMVIFYICAFVFGGLGTGLAYLTGGRFITARNGIIYADFSMPALVITSIAASICIGIYKRISDCGGGGSYTVIVSDCGRTMSFKAMADTGNILKDSFTGKFVIVCPKDVLIGLYGKIPDCESVAAGKSSMGKRWRIIPYSTVSSSGMIAVICPMEVCIKNDETGHISRADVYLGAAQNDCSEAVFNPKILI